MVQGEDSAVAEEAIEEEGNAPAEGGEDANGVVNLQNYQNSIFE